MSALETMLPGFLCRAKPAKAPNKTLFGKKHLLGAAAVSASYLVYKSGFLERASDYFFSSRASEWTLEACHSKANGFSEASTDQKPLNKASNSPLSEASNDQKKPLNKAPKILSDVSTEQKRLIEAMNIPYKIEVLVKNKGGEAKTAALSPVDALQYLEQAKQVAIGDLHASPQKLLETLAVANMIQMPKDDMHKLLEHLKQLQDISNSNNPDMQALKMNYHSIIAQA